MPTITKKQYNEYMRLCQQRDEGKILTPDGCTSSAKRTGMIRKR